MVNFTHFNKKNTHINACKIVHIYKNAIVTMHICTITVALHTNILLISHFAHFFFSLFSICKINASSLPHHLLLPLIHTLPQTQNQNQPQTPQNQTQSHIDTPTETKRVDRHLWRIGVCGLVSFNHGGSASDREWREEFQMGNGERV